MLLLMLLRCQDTRHCRYATHEDTMRLHEIRHEGAISLALRRYYNIEVAGH